MEKATKIPCENLPRFFLTANTPYFNQNFQALRSNLAEQQTREQEDLFPRFLSFSFFPVSFSTFFRCLHFSIEIYFSTIVVSLSIRGKLVFRSSLLDKQVQLFANFKRILLVSFHFVLARSKSVFLLQTRLSPRGPFGCFSECKD